MGVKGTLDIGRLVDGPVLLTGDAGGNHLTLLEATALIQRAQAIGLTDYKARTAAETKLADTLAELKRLRPRARRTTAALSTRRGQRRMRGRGR